MKDALRTSIFLKQYIEDIQLQANRRNLPNLMVEWDASDAGP